MKQIINSSHAPAAIGPYSQAVMANGFLFISGQLPIDVATGAFAGDDITSQTNQSLSNLSAILSSAGLTMQNVIKVNIYLQDMGDFDAMNAVYSQFFTSDYPARAAVQVARLPRSALVEIEAVACVE